MVTHGYMLNLDLNYEAVKKYIEISPKSFSQIGIVPFPKVVEARGQDQSIGSARPATTFLSITLTPTLNKQNLCETSGPFKPTLRYVTLDSFYFLTLVLKAPLLFKLLVF